MWCPCTPAKCSCTRWYTWIKMFTDSFTCRPEVPSHFARFVLSQTSSTCWAEGCEVRNAAAAKLLKACSRCKAHKAAKASNNVK